MANVIPWSLRKKLETCYSEGLSLQVSAHRCGISKVTVLRYFKLFDSYGKTRTCKCGVDAREHQGWCWWRFMQSARRQHYMKSRGHYWGPISGELETAHVSRMDTERKFREEKKTWREAREKLKEIRRYLNPRVRQSQTRAS